MDFTLDDALAGYREQAREWVDAHIPSHWREQVHREYLNHHPELHSVLAEQGLLGADWPAEYGGTGDTVDPAFARAVFEEITALGMRSSVWGNTQQVVGTVLRVGTEEQRREYVTAAARGSVTFSLGFTEPGCGSDAAAARTRAVRDGDEWVINGAKMFTSSANFASHVILLTRTNPDVPKHRGLTVFLVPLDRPGVDIRPIATLSGERTNATYYTDVRIPDSARLGDVDQGWSVMRVALVFERTGGNRPTGPTLVQRVAEWARSTDDEEGRPLLEALDVRERLARLAIADEVSRLLHLQIACISQQGELPRIEGPIAKLYTTEHNQRAHAALLDLMGLTGTLAEGAEGAPLNGAVEQAFRGSVIGTIYGGASEILRDMIAEGRLGLPRSRPVG
jgi:alkylation response protein AidB-like acyl-CoA dehydrogenase